MTTPPLPREPRTFADQGSVARLNSARPGARDIEFIAPETTRAKPELPGESDAPSPRVDPV